MAFCTHASHFEYAMPLAASIGIRNALIENSDFAAQRVSHVVVKKKTKSGTYKMARVLAEYMYKSLRSQEEPF